MVASGKPISWAICPNFGSTPLFICILFSSRNQFCDTSFPPMVMRLCVRLLGLDKPCWFHALGSRESLCRSCHSAASGQGGGSNLPGYPNSWMVYSGKSWKIHLFLFLGGYPHRLEPPLWRFSEVMGTPSNHPSHQTVLVLRPHSFSGSHILRNLDMLQKGFSC